MSYIDNNLMRGEEIVYRTKLHRIVFLWPVIWLVVAILFFSIGGYATTVGWLFILIAIATGIGPLINYSTSEFGITNKRVMVKVGFIHRNSVEILLNKVEGIQVNQSILGRILGYGSIIIIGTGGTKDSFHQIFAPLEFRRKAQEQIANVQESK
ncbi:bacterial membrane flanked domain protein [archaeon]|nr:bacterial membrane flanked domain protein [archaeon]